MFVQIGPVSIADKLSKDVILQLNTSIDSGGEFYTDGSGMELMKRKLGTGTVGVDAGVQTTVSRHRVPIDQNGDSSTTNSILLVLL